MASLFSKVAQFANSPKGREMIRQATDKAQQMAKATGTKVADLKEGVSYGGITIANPPQVTVDTARITDLTPGTYQIAAQHVVAGPERGNSELESPGSQRRAGADSADGRVSADRLRVFGDHFQRLWNSMGEDFREGENL